MNLKDFIRKNLKIILLISLVLVLIISNLVLVTYKKSQKGTLKVTTENPGMYFKIDNIEKRETFLPTKEAAVYNYQLPVGKHTFKAYNIDKNSQIFEKSFSLKKNETITVDIILTEKDQEELYQGE